MNKSLLAFLFLSIAFLSSCEDDNCRSCTVIIEDNAFAAEDACLGFSSPYPDGYLIVTEFTDFYCDQDLDEVRAQEGEDFVLLCPDVFVSRITTVFCD